MPQAAPEIIATVPQLPPRPKDAHKGDFGRVLIVAGSRGMSGAAVLCGSAGLRGGAGLVQIAVPGEILPIVAAGNPCYMVAPCAQDLRGRFAASAVEELLELANDWADVIAIGPGLGQSDAMPNILAALIERAGKPLVIDADGINALARLRSDALWNRPAPIVLTPHPGEFARLTELPVADVQANREKLATTFAIEHGVVVVLKGHQSLVADRKRLYRNTTGNPGMATGGMGDVLTGLIAALMAQKLPAFEATVLGVWAHGQAGDLAAAHMGQTALIASDLLAHFSTALAASQSS